MAEAKITIETIADNSKLRELNKELASGTQNLKALKAQYKDWAKEGTHTAEEMAKLNAQISVQKALNTQASKSIRNLSNELVNAKDKASGLANAFSNAIGSKLGVNVGELSAGLTSMTGAMTMAVGGAVAIGAALVKSNIDMQNFVNGFRAFATETENATQLYQRFNTVYRDTNFSESGVYEMAQSLMRVGYNAKDAEAMLRRVSDAAAGLGTGEQGAKDLVNTINRITTVGSITTKQLATLKTQGIDLCAIAAEKMGISYEEASQAISDGTIDNTELIRDLYDALGQYDGKMAEVKDNAIDAWGDLTGNVTELIRETSNLVAETMGYENTTQAIQAVASVVQDMIDLVKDLTGTVSECKAWILDTFGEDTYNAIMSLINPVQALIGWIKDAARAFRNLKNAITGEGGTEGYTDYDSDYHDKVTSGYALNIPTRAGGYSGGADTGSGGSGGSDAEDKAAQRAAEKAAKELEKQKQKLKDETKRITEATLKIEERETQESEKYGKIREKIALIGKSGLDLERTKHQQEIDNYDAQIAKEEELAQKKVATIQAERDALQQAMANGTAIDGTQAKIDALNAQIEAEKSLSDQKIMNIMAEKEASDLAYGDTSDLTNKDPGSNLSTDTIDGLSQGIEMIKSKWATFSKLIQTDSPQLKLAFNAISTPFASMAESIINGTKSAGQAMKDFAKQMITQALNLLAQWTAIFALVSVFQGPAVGAKVATQMVLGIGGNSTGSSSLLGNLPTTNSGMGYYNGSVHYAEGGFVGGGAAGIDTVPAMLSNGEYVLNNSAVNAIGASALDAINAGDVSSFGGRNVTLNISTVDAGSFGNWLSTGGGLKAIKQAFADDNRDFGAVSVW